MTDVRNRAATGILTVVVSYALFAAMWILLSDQALGLLFSDQETLVRASMVKGWFFVAVTSLLLYALMRRLAGDLVDAHRRELAFEREREQPPPMLVAITEASTDAIFAKDEDGRYLLLNEATARYAGKAAEAMLGVDDQALFPPEQAAHLVAVDRRVRESGRAEISEETLQTAIGERVFQITKGPLRDAGGRIFGTYGIARDITERKHEEQALRRLADDLNATLQAIPDLMFELDAQGRYVKVKTMNDTLLAAPSEELVGRTVRDALPAEAAATVLEALAAAGRAGSDFGRRITLPLASGDRHFELSVARKPMPAGEGERFIVLSRDVTSRDAAEADLRQRNEDLERFNRAAIERELRMVALKREVNDLARAAGRAAPYDITTVDADGAQTGP